MQPDIIPNNPIPNNPIASPPSALPAREADQLRLLVENARDYAMFLLDLDGTVLSWNVGVQNLLGYEEEEWIGQDSQIIFTPEDRERGEPLKERETAATTGRAEDDRWQVRKDGTRFFASGVMSAVYDEAGKLVSLGKVLRDHTDQKQTEEELRAAAEEVAEVNAALLASGVTLEAQVRERTASQREITRQVLAAQEDERRRISRELHDSTGQYMAALAMELDQVERVAGTIRRAASEAALHAAFAASLAMDASHKAQTMASEAALTGAAADAARLAAVASEAARSAAIAGTDAGAAATAANTAMAVVDEAAPRVARLRSVANGLSRDIHSMAVGLRPTSLDDLGLVPALTALCEEWAERSGVTPGFVEIGMGAERLPPEVETVVYRVVQEAMTNAAKYALPAGHTKVSVTLQREDGYVQAVVEDDGPGFDFAAARSGRLGLAGMRERAELAGGTLEIESEPGMGTTVFLRLPV